MKIFFFTFITNHDTQQITITNDDIFIEMYIGNSKAYVNGNEIQLDTIPAIKSNRTLIPLRFVAESLQLTVQWIGDSKTIIIE